MLSRDPLEIDIGLADVRDEILDIQPTRRVDGLHLLNRLLHLLLTPPMKNQVKPLCIQLLCRASSNPISGTSDEGVWFWPAQESDPTSRSKVMKPEKVKHAPDVVESEE